MINWKEWAFSLEGNTYIIKWFFSLSKLNKFSIIIKNIIQLDNHYKNKSHLHFISFAQKTIQIFILTFHYIFCSKSGYWNLMEWYSWIRIKHSQVFEYFLSYFCEILGRIFVFCRFYCEMKFTIRLISLIKLICFWNVTIKLLANSYSSLISP